ncbi:MAG: ATP-binding protein, partial [Desulfoferrobacter sp.]
NLTEIQIGYEQTDRFHVMSVRDNGAGIKGEGSEELFNFFERYGAAKEIEGTGLGLAIVKEIAEQHGGRVWMEAPPEMGTTFFISIARNL